MQTPFPLGRVVEHDPRSLAFPVVAAAPPQVRSRTWRGYGRVLDQGKLGSCTGNAMAQALNHQPLRVRGRTLVEADAVDLYSRATVLDSFPGSYPPDDTGSSGLAVAKAAQQRGLIRAYAHGFGLDQTLAGLMGGPALIGTAWHQDMFEPDAQGMVRPTGAVAGGHEYLLIGVDVKAQVAKFLNSWTAAWGDRGRFYMRLSDFAALLDDDGDATFPQI